MKQHHFFRKEWKKIIIIFILSGIVTIINLLTPQFTSKLLVNLSNFKKALLLASVLFLLGLLSPLLNLIKSKISIRCKMSISKNIKMVVAKNLINSTSSSIKKYNNNERLASIVCEGDNLVNNIFVVAGQWISILSGIFVLIYTAFISLPIFLLFISSFIILLIYQKSTLGKLSAKAEKRQTAYEKTHGLILEGIEAILDVKGQLLGPNLKHIFEESLKNESTSSIEETDAIAKNDMASSIVLQTLLFAFLGLGLFLIKIGNLSIEELITLYMYKNYIMLLVSSISRVLQYYSKYTVSKNRIDEILCYNSILEKEEYGHKHFHPEDVVSNINLKNVSVNVEGKTILDNISLEIKPNSFIGIVGEGGCGKSTLLKVLSRDIIPDTGIVELDGMDIRKIDDYTIRSIIRHAPQTPFIFTMTLRENLQLANSKATEKDMWKALRYADADKFVRNLENGLDTVINRATLSGSQLQRLALARIPLRTSKIILLDEATSAMDNITQSRIMSTLKSVTKNHTVIMVAHRIHILQDADVIIYMDNGKIVDKGTYSELYKNPSFRKLADEG